MWKQKWMGKQTQCDVCLVSLLTLGEGSTLLTETCDLWLVLAVLMRFAATLVSSFMVAPASTQIDRSICFMSFVTFSNFMQSLSCTKFVLPVLDHSLHKIR